MQFRKASPSNITKTGMLLFDSFILLILVLTKMENKICNWMWLTSVICPVITTFLHIHTWVGTVGMGNILPGKIKLQRIETMIVQIFHNNFH